MADTVRTLAALQALLADNITGDISPQDLRDMLVSIYRRQQAIIVAKNGGEYDKIQDAIDSITDASASKIYTVLVYPGEYDEVVTLKDYVNIVAVDRGATKIIGRVLDGGAAVHCRLEIDIESQSTGDLPGLSISGASVISGDANIVANLTGSGVSNSGSGTVTVNNATGGNTGGFGVNNSGSGTVNANIVTGGNNAGTTGGMGVQNSSSGTVNAVNIIGGNGNILGGFGVYNSGSGTVNAKSIISGTGGTSGQAAINMSAGTVNVVDGNVISSEVPVSMSGSSTVKITRGNIISTYNNAAGHGVTLAATSIFQHEYGKIVLTHADAKAIYCASAVNVRLYGVYGNRDLDANVTNLIAGGYTYDADVQA